MNNVIFGSGIVGLIAKALLPQWKIIPFGRSRFFSFNPAIDDNFIIHHDDIKDAVVDIQQSPVKIFPYRRTFDVNGYLYSNYDKLICDEWLLKIFGANVPPQSELCFRNNLNLSVYDVRLNQLYALLIERYLPELKEEHHKGKITEIGDHYYVRNGVKEEFDHAVNTIPLPAINKLIGVQQSLSSKSVHLFHINTNNLDFEGNNQIFVVDPKFSFYKVTNVAPSRYLFYCHEDIAQPGPYFMALLRDFDILDGTSVSDYLTMGQTPKLEYAERLGIYSVGSYAQWDWCMDVSSCILRLVRYAGRNFKPFKRELAS